MADAATAIAWARNHIDVLRVLQVGREGGENEKIADNLEALLEEIERLKGLVPKPPTPRERPTPGVSLVIERLKALGVEIGGPAQFWEALRGERHELPHGWCW